MTEAVQKDRGVAALASGVVICAVVFNAVLALVNAHVRPLGPGSVIAVEAAIVVAAHAVALLRLRAQMLPWYTLLVPIAAFCLLRGVASEGIELRYARDLALIPTFVVLGMCFPREKLPQFLVALHVIVLAGLLLEWASPDAYAKLFAIKDYYVNTRGLTAESFWNTESTLFVSATRPDDRFFGFVNWHRMSSVFLEPVSLGNYCIFVVACLVAVPHLLKRWQILMLGAGTALMLVACDGRLATVTILFIAVFAVMAPRLPERVTLLLPLLIMFCASAFVVAFAVSAGSDTFPGRVAHTVHLLGRMSLVDWMGASDLLLPLAVDSGIAYLIITQSVAVTLLFWITFVMAADEADAPAARYKAGVAAYLALSMLVSFSFLSIKTAAPLWFVLGALQLARVHAPATASPVRLRRAVA